MTDSVNDILARYKIPEEPEEFKIIRTYLHDRYNSSAKLSQRDDAIIIEVNNASLAGTLRMQLHELSDLCQTQKRLIIRIS